jgi:hypothetical protein
MNWFKDFVEYTVDAWYGSGKADLSEVIGNPVEVAKMTAPEIGLAGEEYVASLLIDLGYDAVISPGSRSPADVWAIQKYEDFIHIALTQVKTSYDIPRKLGRKEINELEVFADFVWENLDEYHDVSENIIESGRIISCGYAGVMIVDVKGIIQPYVFSSEFIDAVYSEDLEELKDAWRDVIEGIHEM